MESWEDDDFIWSDDECEMECTCNENYEEAKELIWELRDQIAQILSIPLVMNSRRLVFKDF